MDKILRGTAFDNQIAVAVLQTTQMVNTAMQIHKLSATAAAAMGRTLTAAAYMCSLLKNHKDSLSISIKGDGLGGNLTVCGNAKLQMRGFVENPTIELAPNSKGKLDVAKFIGKGTMTVVKDLGLKMPYTGAIELVSGEIAEDFAQYFLQSEQTPTAVALGVKIGKDLRCIAAGGVIMSPLPSCSQESLALAEEMLPSLSNVSSLIESLGADGVFQKFFPDTKSQEFYPKYQCTCSRDYTEKVIVALGKDEAEDILKTQGEISLHCHFCDTYYKFDAVDIERLFR